MKTDNNILAESMRILSREIQSQDGVANVAIAEAACRIEELDKENKELKAQSQKRSRNAGVNVMNDELEISLLNAAYHLCEANNDIEAYLPPDDSDSWGDNADILLKARDEQQSYFNSLLCEIKAQAIEEAVQAAKGRDICEDEVLYRLNAYARQLRQSAEGEECYANSE